MTPRLCPQKPAPRRVEASAPRNSSSQATAEKPPQKISQRISQQPTPAPIASPGSAVTAEVPALSGRSPRMSHLRQLRMMIDELILKADARDCLLQQGRDRYADRIRCDRDFQQLLSSLQDYIESHGTAPAPAAKLQATAAPSANAGGSTVIKTTVGRIASRSRRYQRRDRVRIQLKVSRPLAQILETLQKSQVRPGETVEEILWESQRMKDLASLVGVQ